MTVRRIGADGGVVTSGQMFTSGTAEIAQTIKTRLRLFSGEYAPDVTEGTPWVDVIFATDKSLSSKEAAIRARILRTPGVKQILTLAMDFDETKRKLAIDGVVLTNLGAVALSDVV